MARSPNASPGAWSVLRQRNFFPYFVGNACSASGTWFQNLAASVLVFRLTHSPLMLGVLNTCQFGPVLLLAPWAGRVADAFDRRRLLLVTQTIAACISGVLAVLVWRGAAGTWTVIAFSTALGVVTAFAVPVQMALVGSLVRRDDLPHAVALNSMTYNLARAVGPALAALVIATLGIAPTFAINAVTFLALVAGVFLVSPAPVPPVRRTGLRESLAFVREQPRLIGYLLIVMAVGMSSDPVNTEGPAIAHAFGYPAVWAGAVVGCFGLGAVMAALAPVTGGVSSHRQMAATLYLFGGGIVAMALSPWFPLALAFLLCAGFGYLSSNAAATTRLQLGVREDQRGRIMALWTVAFLGARPLASLVDGAISAAAGVRVAAPLLAIPVIVAGTLLLRADRSSAREPTLARG
jgi:MFS family permease